jgi:hypothetical protein
MTLKLFALPMLCLPMLAQVDFSGNWAPVFHEDYPERVPGPELGDYAGIPLTPAGRLRADSYDADRISIVTEYQCRPHGGDYSMRGLANMRIDQEIDPLSQKIVSLHTRMGFQEMERTIYLDGRPRPGIDAPHTWQGFSLGAFDQNMLNVFTTHQKTNYVRRNGIPRSADGTFTEHWTRHGNYLTITTVITDPAILAEPLTRSQTWVLDPNQQMTRDICDYTPEVPNPKAADNVPAHLPGANPFLHEVADWYGLPYEATRGGPETMYPEYRSRMGKPDKPVPQKCDRYCRCGENGGPCNLK